MPPSPQREGGILALAGNRERSKLSIAMPREPCKLEPDPVIEAYKKDVDRTLIRENLRLTVEERFEKLFHLQEFALELRRAGREARRKR
jgi:hypothetical protein